MHDLSLWARELTLTAVLVLGVLSMLAGVGLLFAVQGISRLNDILNIACRPSERLRAYLEREIRFDDWILKNHRVLGTLALLISVVLIAKGFILSSSL